MVRPAILDRAQPASGRAPIERRVGCSLGCVARAGACAFRLRPARRWASVRAVTPPQADAFAALRIPAFRTFLTGLTGVFASAQVQTTVLGLQVYALARRAGSIEEASWQVGLIGLAEAIPFLALTLFGGWASDRWDRRWLSAGGMGGLVLAGLWLVLSNVGGLDQTWPLLAAQAIGGASRAVLRPASSALGTELVPVELYANAATWRTNLFHGTTIGGPALGALLYTSIGPLWTYALLLMGYLSGLVAVLRLEPTGRVPPPPSPVFASLREGIRFVFASPVILGALSLDLFAVLFGGAIALIPAFALDVLHTGEASVGLLRASPAVGALLMGAWLSRHPTRRNTGPVLFGCVAAFGVTWLLFALSPWFWLSAALLAAGGALDNVSMVLRATLLQTYTPPHLMGRVSAVNGFFIGSSNELGAFESGATARLLGLVNSVLVGGALTVLTAVTTAWLCPPLRRLDRIERARS